MNTTCTMSLGHATLVQFFQVVSRVVASRNIFTSLTRGEPAPIGSTFSAANHFGAVIPGRKGLLMLDICFPPRMSACKATVGSALSYLSSTILYGCETYSCQDLSLLVLYAISRQWI